MNIWLFQLLSDAVPSNPNLQLITVLFTEQKDTDHASNHWNIFFNIMK